MHAGKDAVHPGLVYLSCPLMLKHSFNEEIIKFALVIEDGDPDLFRVDQICYYFFCRFE
ncbi:hypothetical protein SDC9_133860 [bioreactor metagenome]|uniref:Uncharacterized protein n=1 Tax=bioreactor metagenome TaxID=1076179 RepID=A0A645DCL8_9ZZZZ